MASIDPVQLARELHKQTVNGNRGGVSERLSQLSAPMAAAVAFYLRDQISDSYLISVMGRLLERKAIEDQKVL